MSKFNFERLIRNLQQMNRELPRILVNDAQNYFLATFRKQGFAGMPWAEVQRRIAGTSAYEYPKKRKLSRRTKPINIDTGRLRRAVASTASTARISYNATGFIAVMRVPSSSVPYARYINDGTDRMPARPFMKASRELTKIHTRRINSYIDKLWKR